MIERIYQSTGKIIFHCGKWNEPIGNFPHIRMFVQMVLKLYIFLAHVYKAIALANDLTRLMC